MNYWCYCSTVGIGLEERYFSEGAVYFWRSPKEKWNQMTRGVRGLQNGDIVCKVTAMYCLASNVNVELVSLREPHVGWGVRSPAFNLCCEQGCLAPMIIEKPPLVSPMESPGTTVSKEPRPRTGAPGFEFQLLCEAGCLGFGGGRCFSSLCFSGA